MNLGGDAEVGGIRFTHGRDGPVSGSLLARGMAVEESRGFSASLETHTYLGDVPTEGPCELHASTLVFGDLGALLRGAEVIVHPHLLLRNVSQSPLPIECTVEGKDSSGLQSRMPLRPMTLEAGEAVHLDLELQRRDSEAELADGISTLEVLHKGRPTDLVTEVINVDETGDFCLYDRVVNLYSYKPVALVAISFSLSEDRRTFLVLKNVTHRAQRARILIDYRQGAQCFEQVLEVAARGVAVVDIAQLSAEQVPDLMHRTLSVDVGFGGCIIAVDEPGTFIGANPTFVLKRSASVAAGQVGETVPLAPPGGFSCTIPRPNGEMAPPPPGLKIYSSSPFRGKDCLISQQCGGNHRALDVGFVGIREGSRVFPVEAGQITDIVRGRPRCEGPSCEGPNGVIIRGRDGAHTLYYHVNASVLLDVGDAVGVDTAIGFIDLSGETSGPHLHLERHRPGFGGTFADRESTAGEDFITCTFTTPCKRR